MNRDVKYFSMKWNSFVKYEKIAKMYEATPLIREVPVATHELRHVMYAASASYISRPLYVYIAAQQEVSILIMMNLMTFVKT